MGHPARLPPYAYGVYNAAQLASRLCIGRISAIECGVAGGRGLLALEKIAAEAGAHFGVEIDVVGFDTGQGMPDPVDYRDLPHVWNSGFYRMDVDKLRQRLTTAKLLLGDIAETAQAWLAGAHEAPIGCVAFDLDYYSSTTKALRKICQIRNLRCARKRDEAWYAQIYAFHDFDHPRYAENVAPKDPNWRQLPI